MSDFFANWDEEVFDLAIERINAGVDAERDVMADVDAAELEELELAAAALHLAALSEQNAAVEAPQPSADFLRELEERGRALVTSNAPAEPRIESGPLPLRPVREPSSGSGFLAAAGWLVAAGLLGFLLLTQRGGSDTPATPSFAEARTTLIASAADLKRGDWGETEDPLAAGVSGDVVWSSDAQEGYMRFSGLAANDPTEKQYQLWIFDSTRDEWEDMPVDGGVFDVGASGEVIVPIDAKLDVRDAVLFAITLEEPGGVVVSKRNRLIVTAGA